MKKKILSVFLSSVIFTSMSIPVSAQTVSDKTLTGSDIGDLPRTESIEVTYQQPSVYSVVIPKTISLDNSKEATYSVTVKGDLSSGDKIVVEPVDAVDSTPELDFLMHDQSGATIKKSDVTATITQEHTVWTTDEAGTKVDGDCVGTSQPGTISAPGLSAGVWAGTFNFSVRKEARN